MKTKIKRNSNIELLRIISMLMVLVLHCLAWGGALDYNSGINLCVYWWMEALSIIAVDVFVLISSYFLIEVKFKAKNVFKVAVGGVWIYSVLFTFIAMKIDTQAITITALIKACVPILTKKYWFVNSYVLMYIVSPYLNKLIHSLSKKQFSILTGYLLIFFSIRSTIFPMTWSQDDTAGMGIIGFVMLYCIGAWIRLYYKRNGRILKWLCIYLGMSFLLVVSKVGIIMIGADSLSTKFYSYASPLVIMEAVSLFLVFLNKNPMKQGFSNSVNKIAKHSFSVYIIHFSMLNVLFTKIFCINNYLDNVVTGILEVVLSVIIIYAVCTVIDIIKCYLFDQFRVFLKDSAIERKYSEICLKWESQVNEVY